VDSGPVAYDTRFDVTEADTALTLSAKCVNLGLPLIEQLLRDAGTGSVPMRGEDTGSRRHHGEVTPQNGVVNWIRHAVDIVNFVRACDYLPFRSPWGHPKTHVRDLEFMITKAKLTHLPCSEAPGTVGGTDGRSVLVAAVDEWVMVRRLCLDGRHLDATDLLSPGDRLHEGGSPLALTTP
jgi:UDP-4-amino-4-deoxy-L-arabinose formyltransferase/UDP-glucuronic acid dehydrogenase (UDP-4-keto-hexauronic acid decarboxylating)